jgi:hypothetical protein
MKNKVRIHVNCLEPDCRLLPYGVEFLDFPGECLTMCDSQAEARQCAQFVLGTKKIKILDKRLSCVRRNGRRGHLVEAKQ